MVLEDSVLNIGPRALELEHFRSTKFGGKIRGDTLKLFSHQNPENHAFVAKNECLKSA